MKWPPKNVDEAMEHAKHPVCPKCGELGKRKLPVFDAILFWCKCGHDWGVGMDPSGYAAADNYEPCEEPLEWAPMTGPPKTPLLARIVRWVQWNFWTRWILEYEVYTGYRVRVATWELSKNPIVSYKDIAVRKYDLFNRGKS